MTYPETWCSGNRLRRDGRDTHVLCLSLRALNLGRKCLTPQHGLARSTPQMLVLLCWGLFRSWHSVADMSQVLLAGVG